MSELRITFLGTGSGRPTPRRNCAAVHLQYGPDAVLFDCGEGTQLQIVRAGVRPTRLQLIALSHFHGDHVNGLPGFLGTLGLNGHRDPLTIAAPAGLDRYFATLRELGILRPAFPVQLVDAARGLLLQTPDYAVHAVPVEHRGPTFAFLFVESDRLGRFDVERAVALGLRPGPVFGQLQRGQAVVLDDGRRIEPADVIGPTRPGRRVAYVTDTRPCLAAVELARGADILIHEATYAQELHAHALERKHSTTTEAAEVALRAGVRQLILSHISPKHSRTRELLREARAVFPNTELAEDLAEFELPMH